MKLKISTVLSHEWRHAINFGLARLHTIILNYHDDPERRRLLDLVCRINRKTWLAMNCIEACQLYNAVIRTAKVEGDVAEVGVYTGASARLICEAKGNRTLHLFDTFEGTPAVDTIDSSYKQGDWAASLEEVQVLLKDYTGVRYYQGVFPETAGPVRDRSFSLVHLDAGVWKSTRDCLAFFYPHMSRGGVVLLHDYSWAAGVKKAVDEFFVDKPEPVLILAGSQCLVVKTGDDLR